MAVPLKLSIASYSFHRLLESGQQDMAAYIAASKRLGATHLDPWNAHLAPLTARDQAIRLAGEPVSDLSPDEKAYLLDIKAQADAAGLLFGCVAVDGAHIYEAESRARLVNHGIARRWLEAARMLDAQQVRIDAGGQGDGWPDDVFAMVVAGYQELIAQARQMGLEILMENHWGPSHVAENVVRIMEAVPGLGLLFDTNNFSDQEKGWRLCTGYARSVHVKSFLFDASGSDPSVDLPRVIRLLANGDSRQPGYTGVWGVESVPTDGDEMGAASKTLDLIRRVLSESGG